MRNEEGKKEKDKEGERSEEDDGKRVGRELLSPGYTRHTGSEEVSRAGQDLSAPRSQRYTCECECEF